MTFNRRTDYRERREAEKQSNLMALCQPRRGLHEGTYEGGTAVAVPKGEPARPGKRTPTKDEREWMSAIVRYGCVACRQEGRLPRPTAVHHILRGGVRMGHLFTIGLCDPGHHQGGEQYGMTSRHPYKARFEAEYGTEQELLAGLRAVLKKQPDGSYAA